MKVTRFRVIDVIRCSFAWYLYDNITITTNYYMLHSSYIYARRPAVGRVARNTVGVTAAALHLGSKLIYLVFIFVIYHG